MHLVFLNCTAIFSHLDTAHVSFTHFNVNLSSPWNYANMPPVLGAVVCGGGPGTSSRVFSAISLWKPMPTPSMTASRTAHPIALLRAALTPPRTAREPPVKKPAITIYPGQTVSGLIGRQIESAFLKWRKTGSKGWREKNTYWRYKDPPSYGYP